ncbi:MAG: hypothetical protein ACFCU3_09790 [Verrucomicrobiales bacterium]
MTCLVSACSTNPLAQGYRSAPAVEKRSWRNSAPALVEVPPARHQSEINQRLQTGWQIVGVAERTATGPIHPQNAMMLALEKNADAVVYTREHMGEGIERVAVPVSTTSGFYSDPWGPYGLHAGYGRYGRRGGFYGSASFQSTVYAYEHRLVNVWRHWTTLLRNPALQPTVPSQ